MSGQDRRCYSQAERVTYSCRGDYHLFTNTQGLFIASKSYAKAQATIKPALEALRKHDSPSYE